MPCILLVNIYGVIFFYKLHFGFNESAFDMKLLASAYLVWSFISTTSRRANHNLDILSKRIVHVSQESKKKIMILKYSNKSSDPRLELNSYF